MVHPLEVRSTPYFQGALRTSGVRRYPLRDARNLGRVTTYGKPTGSLWPATAPGMVGLELEGASSWARGGVRCGVRRRWQRVWNDGWRLLEIGTNSTYVTSSAMQGLPRRSAARRPQRASHNCRTRFHRTGLPSVLTRWVRSSGPVAPFAPSSGA